MKTPNFRQLVFTFLIAFGSSVFGQESIVRISLKTLNKPAFDLVDSQGQRLSIGQIKSRFDNGIDLSTLNPVENKFWQDNEGHPMPAIDHLLHAQMPTPEQGLVFDSFVGVVRELGMYAINVRHPNNPNQIFRLKSGLQVHSSLLKAALLRKVGIFQESPKYYQSVRVKFNSLTEMNDFIKQAFCVGGPDEVAISCLSIDPDDRGFISQKDEANLSLVLHGSYLEKMNAEVPNLFDGLTPSNENTLSLYAQSRAYRALIAPYVIADVGESVNRYSAQSVSVRGEYAFLNFAFASDFNNITSYDDVRWILRKMAVLSDNDWNEIMEAAAFPQSIQGLVKAKLLHRFNNMVETFFDRNEQKQLVRVQIPELNITTADGVVQNGKVTTQKIAGYPQRFSHGDRQSPFESGDFIKYLKIKAQSSAIETALMRFSDKLQKMSVLNQDIIGVEVGPNGMRPLVDADFVSFGVNTSANRIVTTGTYYGSQAAVQVVDSLTLAANAGYFHVLDGLNGIDTVFGGGVSYIRNFIHVSPIGSMEEAGKIPLKNLYIPSKLKKLTSPLKDGKLTEFLQTLKVGEVFTITDSIGLSGQIGFNTALDAIVGFATYGVTVGLAADGNKVIMRQIQFVRTNEGLQVYVRNQNNKAFGLEFNVNYFINLFKLRSQTTWRDIKTKVYMLNYNSTLISQVDNMDIIPDEKLQQRVDTMRNFGNKAALALRSLLTESSTEALDTGLQFQKFEVEHELKTKEVKTKFLWLRSSKMQEEHLLTIKKPEVPTMINDVQVVNEPVKIVTYKKGRLKGKDWFGFGLELTDGVLRDRMGGNAPANLSQMAQNPSQMPFGKSEWTTVRTDTELTSTRPGALPTVAVVESVWGGWSLKRNKLNDIVSDVREKTKGVNFADFPLVPNGALANVDKIDFYRVTSHLSVLPPGIEQIKNLMLSPDVPDTVTKKKTFLGKFFQKLSGGPAHARDKVLYSNIIKIIGNGDEAAGQKIYMEACREQQSNRRSTGNGKGPTVAQTNEWYKGTEYECLADWVEKLISLSRKFPATDLRSQNRWLTEVIYVLDEHIPLAAIMNYLGKDKFIYYLEVTGFRSGDEDGDEGVYVSNVYGEPAKRHPYANGLISVIADKSKINSTELEQTAGGF